MADFIVVGAGFSGLMAARKIHTSHPDASVLVLEARDRVGGRMFAREAGGERKGWVDLGGQWLGEDHPRIRTLAKELGLEIFEQHTDGLDVVRFDGSRYLDDSETPAPNAQDREAAEELLEALERTAD